MAAMAPKMSAKGLDESVEAAPVPWGGPLEVVPELVGAVVPEAVREESVALETVPLVLAEAEMEADAEVAVVCKVDDLAEAETEVEAEAEALEVADADEDAADELAEASLPSISIRVPA